MKRTKARENSPRRMGASSQSRKNRMTRHLAARSRWTGSLTSSANKQVHSSQAPNSDVGGPNKNFTYEPDGALGIPETLDRDGRQ